MTISFVLFTKEIKKGVGKKPVKTLPNYWNNRMKQSHVFFFSNFEAIPKKRKEKKRMNQIYMHLTIIDLKSVWGPI